MAADHTTAIFAAELILLLFFGRLIGEGMARIGQPAIFGQLLAGVLLGPSVFGALLPGLRHMVFPETPALKSMIDAVSQIGILLLLLLTGMETNLALVNRKRAGGDLDVAVRHRGAVRLRCGLAYALPTELIPSTATRLVTALFLGTALSISSVKIVAMVLMEIGAIRRDLGQLILATAILDDSLAWIIIAVISGIAAYGAVNFEHVGMSIGLTALFLAVSLTVGKRAVARIIVWCNDNLTIEGAGDQRHPAHHADAGAHHRADRRAHRAGRLRRRHPDRPVADPERAYRRPAARLHHRLLQPGVLRRGRARHGPAHAARSDAARCSPPPSS